MKAIGVDGSTTSHGGTVQATQNSSSTDGKHWLVEGDGFNCPKCKTWSTLIRNNSTVSVLNKKVALVGDQFTCGATLEQAQSRSVVGGSKAGGASSSVLDTILTTAENVLSSNLQSDLVSNLNDNKEIYENYYIENQNTEHVAFRPITIPVDSVGRGRAQIGIGGQIAAGACTFVVYYSVKGTKLFVTASYFPPSIKNLANKIFPFGAVKVFRENARQFHLIAHGVLTIGDGVWDTERGKLPVGSCSIELPPSNLSLLKVEADLGYRISVSGGTVAPSPALTTHTFTITSAARRIQ